MSLNPKLFQNKISHQGWETGREKLWSILQSWQLVWFAKLQNCREDLAKIQKSTDSGHTWYSCHFLAPTNKRCSMKHCTCQMKTWVILPSAPGAHNCQHGLEMNLKMFENSSPAGVLKHPLWIRHVASGASCLRSASDSSASCRCLCRQPPVIPCSSLRKDTASYSLPQDGSAILYRIKCSLGKSTKKWQIMYFLSFINHKWLVYLERCP